MRGLKLAALMSALTLTMGMGACGTLSGGQAGGAFCDVARPQRPSKDEIQAMTPERRRGVLAHNRHGAEACGWRP